MTAWSKQTNQKLQIEDKQQEGKSFRNSTPILISVAGEILQLQQVEVLLFEWIFWDFRVLIVWDGQEIFCSLKTILQYGVNWTKIWKTIDQDIGMECRPTPAWIWNMVHEES